MFLPKALIVLRLIITKKYTLKLFDFLSMSVRLHFRDV